MSISFIVEAIALRHIPTVDSNSSRFDDHIDDHTSINRRLGIYKVSTILRDLIMRSWSYCAQLILASAKM